MRKNSLNFVGRLVHHKFIISIMYKDDAWALLLLNIKQFMKYSNEKDLFETFSQWQQYEQVVIPLYTTSWQLMKY